MKQRRAIVIGAGLGGLALSLRLAAQGWQVTVCEQGPTPGGKMNVFEKEGYRFDTGPSLVTMPEIFEELFAVAGSRLADHVSLERIAPHANYIYPDGTKFVHSTSLPDWLSTVRNLDRRDIDGFWRFLGLGARLYELSRETFLARSPYEKPEFGQLRALRHLPLRYGWGNYNRTIQAHFHSPHLQQLYNRYPTYVGSSPYRAPATLAVIPYIEHAFGGWYIKGGLYMLVRALTALLSKHNVELLTSSQVVHIIERSGKIEGVQLSGGRTLTADIVVMNGDASAVPQLLGRSGSSPMPQKDRSLSGLVFLVGLTKKLPELHHHNVYFSSDYKQEFSQLFDGQRFPDDPTVYVNIPSRTDPTVAPPNGETLFIMANAPAVEGAQWDGTATEQSWTNVYDRLLSSGFPRLEGLIAFREAWTPARFAERYAMPGGAIYGMASHGWKSAFFRPANRDRSLRGLYYVGGSSHPGGGTPMVLLSAKITSRMIAGDGYA